MQEKTFEQCEEPLRKIKRTESFILDTLCTVVEFRGSENGQHIKRMRVITKMLMEKLVKQYPEYSLTPDQIEMISNAAAFHDIGKILIPEEILNKPGRLTYEEYEIMKTHSRRGCELLGPLDDPGNEEFFRYCYDICRHHHERWDGKGYPDEIAGDKIPIWAQVAGIVDVYDALTGERVYKPPYTHGEAVDMIFNGECGEFNPKLLECFTQIEAKISHEQLNIG